MNIKQTNEVKVATKVNGATTMDTTRSEYVAGTLKDKLPPNNPRYRRYARRPLVRRYTSPLPIYVPEYIVPYSESSKSVNTEVISIEKPKPVELKTRNFAPRDSVRRINISVEEIRKKYERGSKETEVPVREKVALMESWNQGSKGSSLPTQPAWKVPLTTFPKEANNRSAQQKRVQFRVQPRKTSESSSSRSTEKGMNMRLSRDARHRRSMSDPNLQKSFQAMKELWDKKVEQDSKTPPPTLSRNSRGNSVSSNESLDISQPKLVVEKNKESVGKVNTSSHTRPPSPTKTFRGQLEQRNQLGIEPRSKSQSFNAENPGSLVKNRAKMFDVAGSNQQVSNPVNKGALNRKPRSSSLHAEENGDDSYDTGKVNSRKMAFEGNREGQRSSPRKYANNNRVQEKKSDLTRLLDNEEENEKTNYDIDDAIIDRMRKNSGNLARERRKNSRRGSNQSDSDSSSSAVSSLSSSTSGGDLPVLRRAGSKEEGKDPPGSRSPQIRSYLHRKASPKSEPNLASMSSEESKGALGILSPAGSLPIPTAAPRRKSSLHKEHTSGSPKHSPLSEFEASPTAALHRKLSLDAVNRARMSADSGTGTSSPGASRNFTNFQDRESISSAPENFKRGGSFSSGSRTPPPPPPISDKPRVRSASSSPLPIKPSSRPTAPPPPPPTHRKAPPRPSSLPPSNNEPISSPPTNSSSPSLLSTSNDAPFNAEEEYDRILSAISTPTNTRHSFRSSETLPSPTEAGLSPLGSLEIDGKRQRDSLEVPVVRQKNRTSDNESWSDFDISDNDDEGNRAPDIPSHDTVDLNEDVPKKEPLEVKLHNIAKELLSTEETYVEVLHLIDQIFHKRVLEAVKKKQISSEIKNIFSNVSAIYQFHSGYLLPQLKKRLENWESEPRIGDIMKEAAPFLKMYSLYVQNFDEAMNLVKIWSEKSNNFSSIIKSIQASPDCKNLSLQHHMLGPVQRIPRYKMLLEDYLKRLPEDSPDRSNAQRALELISIAATHSNETMKQSDKFQKLLNLYNNLLDVNFDMADVSRELLLEGKIIKISARNGEKHERYLFLFNDMLLCCTPVRRLQRKLYRVSAKIELDGMETAEVPHATIPNTFCVNGTNKSMDFATNSAEETEKWVNAINDAIDSFLERKTSFMKSGSQKRKKISASEDNPPNSPLHLPETPGPIGPVSPIGSPHHSNYFEEVVTTEEKRIEITCTPGNQYVVDIEDHDLGKRAPRWIKDNEVTMCMHCSKAFNRLLRRRHHCRACGRVICTECSEHKLEMQYERGKMQKVCNKCYAILTGRKQVDCEMDKKGVLEVEADIVSGNSIISEYLHFTESERKKAWTKTWCVIPKDELCLYLYGAHQDVRALMTMPLPGFTVVRDSNMDREFSLKLVQARKVLLFAASSAEQLARWEYVFRQASLGKDLSREEVFNLGKSSPQSMVTSGGNYSNGSRLSSSSGESSTVSTASSRPSSLMDRNESYSSISENSAGLFEDAVTLE